MSDRLSTEQQIFLLNLAANSVANETGTVDQLSRLAEQEINALIREHLEPWRIVWGPCVYASESPGLADHVLYAAARPAEGGSPPRIVASIAGTNPPSVHDWRENLAVGQLRPWRWGTSTKQQVAEGAWTGFEHLKDLSPLDGFPGHGQRIEHFLRTQTDSKIEVTVTGFSLGGALSPLVALWLDATRSDWDPDGNASLQCRPVAGPAIGNRHFAGHFDERLSDVTPRLSNRLDVVPHVWHRSDVRKIPGIYDGYARSEIVTAAAAFTYLWIYRKGYTHLGVEKAFDRGILDPSSLDDPLPASAELVASELLEASDVDWEEELGSLTMFIKQAVLQHTKAYFLEMGVDDIIPDTLVAALRSATGTASVEELVRELLVGLKDIETRLLSD